VGNCLGGKHFTPPLADANLLPFKTLYILAPLNVSAINWRFNQFVEKTVFCINPLDASRLILKTMRIPGLASKPKIKSSSLNYASRDLVSDPPPAQSEAAIYHFLIVVLCEKISLFLFRSSWVINICALP
jgi:hypothetical protein